MWSEIKVSVRILAFWLALEKDAPHLKLIEGGKEGNSHKIVTKRKLEGLKPI